MSITTLAISAAVIFTAFALCAETPARPDGAQTAAAPTRSAVPPNVLYRTFFGHVSLLEQEAQDVEKTGKSGDRIRGYYKLRLHLSDQEDGAMRTVAFSCDAAVKAQDATAKQVITKARAQFKANSGFGAGFPPPPPELLQMQGQRDAIISSHIERLKAEMGTAGFEKVDAFVNKAFASRMKMQTLPPATGTVTR